MNLNLIDGVVGQQLSPGYQNKSEILEDRFQRFFNSLDPTALDGLKYLRSRVCDHEGRVSSKLLADYLEESFLESETKLEHWFRQLKAFPFGKVLKLPEKLESSLGTGMDQNVVLPAQQRSDIIRAVSELARTDQGGVILIKGKPGVGKTRLARGLAQGLGRPMGVVNLAGSRHRLLHILEGFNPKFDGADMGCIASMLIDFQLVNPVICLPELDKLGSDVSAFDHRLLLKLIFRGEHLDGYLRTPIDVSKVIWILPYSSDERLQKCPSDMEFDPWTEENPRRLSIELPDLNKETKFKVAKQFLLPKQIGSMPLSNKVPSLSDSQIETLIDELPSDEAGAYRLDHAISQLRYKLAREEFMKGNN